MTAREKTKVIEALVSKLTTEHVINFVFHLEADYGPEIIKDLVEYLQAENPDILNCAWPADVPRLEMIRAVTAADYHENNPYKARTFL